MADGYIHGILVPDSETTIPEINAGLTLAVSENIPAGAPPTPLSAGLVAVTNIDISLGHIYGWACESQPHAAWNAVTPFNPEGWLSKGQGPIDWDISNDNAKEMDIAGIQSNQTGYGAAQTGLFHDFRVCFLNADGVKAILKGEATERTVTAAVASNEVTVTWAGGTWTPDAWIGRVARFLTAGDVVVAERVVWDNTASVLKVNDDGIQGVETPDWDDVAKVVFPDDNWIYDVGSAGLGQEFNGINDFAEYAEVLNLKIKLGGTYTDPSTDQTLAGTTAQLEWDNMYDHADIASHPFADGVARDTVQAQWANLAEYVIFMFQDDGSGNDPVNAYPVTDGGDTGEWFLVTEMQAIHDPAAGATAQIQATVPCPAGSRIAFWVGAKCATTRSLTDRNPKGAPARLEA